MDPRTPGRRAVSRGAKTAKACGVCAAPHMLVWCRGSLRGGQEETGPIVIHMCCVVHRSVPICMYVLARQAGRLRRLADWQDAQDKTHAV